MPNVAAQLVAERFSAAKAPAVANFNCGTEAWSKRIGQWLKGDDVLRSMSKGTQVLLYYVDTDLVGFGSIGETTISDPWPTGRRKPASIIPAVGIDVHFQGKPDNAVPSERYSAQIMCDLIARAMQLPNDNLVLHVHKDNQRAQRLYQRCGFLVLGDSHQDGHYLMALKLR